MGYFDSQEEAAEAYDKEATRLRGSVAILNFPSKLQNEMSCNTRASERLQDSVCETKSGEISLPITFVSQDCKKFLCSQISILLH